MATVRPFICVRPAADKAEKIAALPYDVYNREEAKEVVKKNPQSFLSIDRAETQFGDEVDTYDPRVYEKASAMLQEWIADGSFIRDEEPCYYVYTLTMDGRAQSGIVGCASVDEYVNGVIKKHENTRADKELDRIHHVDVCSAQTGPIFLAYRNNEKIKQTIEAAVFNAKKEQPADGAQNTGGQLLYDFTSEDGIRHTVCRISNPADVEAIRQAFGALGSVYIADGHHRAASAVKVGLKRREEHPDYDGTEEFNYFLSVLFPDDELMIMDYNRVVKDLNGLSTKQFLDKMKSLFDVEKIERSDLLAATGKLQQQNASPEEYAKLLTDATEEVKPSKKGEFSMYLEGSWYRCTMHPEDIPDDPVEGLDVSVLQNKLLAPVLGIGDPKTDKRIDFVGGIRGMKELERRCDTDCKVAFAMYPTSIAELFAVADAGLLMPPKSTWFEPKLRSGLFIHEF
jgi:uncharacterized protein (DUF1015 family)